jgi:hypothetical protein
MEYHEPTTSVLVLHDGELADLAAVIEPLGGIDRRGNPTELDRARVWDVIIASASRMLELHEHLPDTSAVRIAVLDGDSKTLRKMLQRVDTDLLVRQPVHPAALRLLILHALYRGPEKRRNTRVSMGAQVRFRSGLRRRPAILAELSTRGCRMMVDSGCHRAVPDRLVTVILPPEVTCDKRPLSLRGHVMRISSAEDGTDVIAVLFELQREAARKKLESIVSAHSHGPAVLDEAVARSLRSLPIIPDAAEAPPISSDGAGASPALPEAAETSPILSDSADAAPTLCEAADAAPALCEAADAAPALCEDAGPPSPDLDDFADEGADERRTQDRHTISRRIIALGDEAARVLIGRDLSIGGMRIDQTPGLALGDRLKVAVHVRPDGQPLVVSAEIARDDGPDGMALRFVDLSPASSSYLEEMVAGLPSIVESNGSKDGAGVVISELVGRRAS